MKRTITSLLVVAALSMAGWAGAGAAGATTYAADCGNVGVSNVCAATQWTGSGGTWSNGYYIPGNDWWLGAQVSSNSSYNVEYQMAETIWYLPTNTMAGQVVCDSADVCDGWGQIQNGDLNLGDYQLDWYNEYWNGYVGACGGGCIDASIINFGSTTMTIVDDETPDPGMTSA